MSSPWRTRQAARFCVGVARGHMRMVPFRADCRGKACTCQRSCEHAHFTFASRWALWWAAGTSAYSHHVGWSTYLERLLS